jgi:hypothetical protein
MRGLSRIVACSPANRIIRAQVGMTWRAIQDRIDPHEQSVKIMQSYSNFTVGGSVSGWLRPAPRQQCRQPREPGRGQAAGAGLAGLGVAPAVGDQGAMAAQDVATSAVGGVVRLLRSVELVGA